MCQLTFKFRLLSLQLFALSILVPRQIFADCVVENRIANDPSSYSLCEIFRALRNTIPQQTLDAILANHMQQDAQYQEAVKFLSSAEFAEISKTMYNNAQFQQAMRLFQSAGVNTRDIDTLESFAQCFMSPQAAGTRNVVAFIKPNQQQSVQQSAVASEIVNFSINDDNDDFDDEDDEDDDDDDDVYKRRRSFSGNRRCALSTLLNDLMYALDRQNFRLQLNQFLNVNQNFAKFYGIVSKRRNQRILLKQLTSGSLRAPVQVLKQHYIDLRFWLRRLFKLFSWAAKGN